MYGAKEQGRNNYQFYLHEMNAKLSEQLALETALHHALERKELFLHFQPQVDLSSRRVIGMEALMRWRNPDRGLVSPAQFIPLAEETGLIVPIGEWGLRTACIQNKAWQAAGFSPIRVAVNLSARQFQQEKLIEMVERVLRETGLDPNCLELELTESMVMKEDEAIIATLSKLNAMGIHFSIDDFGTGYSSLSYLKRFPIRTLKIDQSFVRNLTTDPQATAIVMAIITLAHSLNMRTLAEAVETEGQLEVLRSLQCGAIQGYWFSRPLPAEEPTKLLAEKNIGNLPPDLQNSFSRVQVDRPGLRGPV